MRSYKALLLTLSIGTTALFIALPSESVPPVTITVPYSALPVSLADLDGDPATGSWSDVTAVAVPLENGEPDPYGSASLRLKHDGAFLYVRIDGSVDVPWASASGTHFWLGFLLSPAAVTGHHRAGQDWVFFGESAYGTPAYPPSAIDAFGSAKPPPEDASQDVEGRMRYGGSAPPYAFTAEFRRPLDSGDAEDIVLLPDGATPYSFAFTTDSNGRGSSGGTIDHAVVTNDNVLRLERPQTGDTQPPTVSVDAPANGSVVQGIVTITATAVDNVAVDRVEFSVNATLLADDRAAPYTIAWNTAGSLNGPYRLSVRAFDTSFNNATAWIDVTLENPDTEPPSADAGPDRSVPPGTPVTFDGSGSADNQGVVNWTWTFTDLGPVTLYGRIATYAFDREGDYPVALTVRDASGNAAQDTAWVNVTADNASPVAVAGPDQEVLPGSLVTLDGSASTDDVGIENYTWTWTDIDTIRLYDPIVGYTFAREGHNLVTLTVRDFTGKLALDTLWVNVTIAVDWATVPTLQVRTTEGAFVQDLAVQLTGANGLLFARAVFTYAATPTDPEAVYFALEFDRSGKTFPMSAGDETIIASRNGPDGQPSPTLDFFASADQARPTPIAESDARLIGYRVEGREYEVSFARSLQATDPDRQVSLLPGVRIPVAFAIGEWGQGSAHAYTLMRWEVVVTATGVSLEALGAGDPAAFYSLANSLGLTVFLVTLGLVGFHFVRRRAWRGKHPVELYCGAGEKIEVERHDLGLRIVHWAHVGLMSIFILTGYSIFAKTTVFGDLTVPVHIVVSFGILSVDYPLQFYFMWRSRELRFLFLPWKDDLLVSVSLITNFFGLTRRYEEHATVDPETKGWYKGRKYCAFQKGLLLMDLAAMFVMALSGYALYWPGQFAWLYDLLRPWGGYFVIRGFHLLMFYYFVSTLVGHVYLSLIPMNWGKLRSIVFGKGKVHRHREPHAPGTVVTVLETVTEER